MVVRRRLLHGIAGRGALDSFWRARRASVATLLFTGPWLVACGARSGLDLQSLAREDENEVGLSPARPGFPDAGLVPATLFDDVRSGCVDIRRRYTPTPPTVILLIDQSASMNERFGGSTRWDVLRQSIIDPDDGLLGWLDEGANVGLTLYTSLDGYGRGRQCPLLEQVEVQIDNAEAIRRFYASAEPMPGGDTPTGDAIDAVVASMQALNAGPARYVLVLTDGVPDTCAEPNPQNGLDETVDAVERAYAGGVIVRTVGVSPAVERRGLQRLANASAGRPLDLVYGTDPDAVQPLYADTESRALAAQLRGVIGDVRNCTVELGTLVGDARAFDGRVVLDGVPLEHDSANGWSFVDDDTIRVHGDACNRVLGDGQTLEVTFPCSELGTLY
jgi:hypothetical protein